ncbi:WD40 repeat domain-containing protein [Truepera radiovictrix]|uniref:Lipoprotein n=1 Tax=Truepera radiovictrix (strain DSM 17093 / CIP 108686 / LMG 22925 / RQ-24) TaxID=649638 RepID=D7CQE5_TRURR|nr:hypothetical protein [Truepera radiovictrix]ADI14929.1 hypothetical protein Trad_1812 [Truepera radiovictrix DSM 17093]WMT56517.1 hypothetical protein RCV51_10945 [Truepera radiovictrix]
MRRTLYSGLLLLGALSGCLRAPPPAALEFGSDPRIFRGAYETELDLRVASPEVSLSADASLLAMGNGDFFHAVQFWDTVSARPLGTLEAGVRVDAVTLTRAGDRVAAVIPDPHDDGPGGVRVWEVSSGAVVHDLPPNTPACPTCRVRSLALSPDETVLAVLSAWPRYKHPDESLSEVSLFDVATGARLGVLRGPRHALEAGYGAVSWCPQGCVGSSPAFGTDTA